MNEKRKRILETHCPETLIGYKAVAAIELGLSGYLLVKGFDMAMNENQKLKRELKEKEDLNAKLMDDLERQKSYT